MAIKVRKRGEDESPDEDEEEQQGSAVAPAEGDPFMRGSMKTLTWLSENQGLVLAGLGLAVVVGIGIYVGSRYMHQQEVAASEGVSGALAAVEMPVDGSPTLQAMQAAERIAAPSDTFGSEKEKWTAVYERAGKTLSKHESSRVAQMARLTRAAAAVRIGKAKTASKLYRQYLDGEPSEESLSLVYYGLSVAEAEQGNYQKAVDALDEMVKADDDYESFALYHKGMYMEEAGKKKKAKKFYNKVLETNPESPYKTDIKRRLALL